MSDVIDTNAFFEKPLSEEDIFMNELKADKKYAQEIKERILRGVLGESSTESSVYTSEDDALEKIQKLSQASSEFDAYLEEEYPDDIYQRMHLTQLVAPFKYRLKNFEKGCDLAIEMDVNDYIRLNFMDESESIIATAFRSNGLVNFFKGGYISHDHIGQELVNKSYAGQNKSLFLRQLLEKVIGEPQIEGTYNVKNLGLLIKIGYIPVSYIYQDGEKPIMSEEREKILAGIEKGYFQDFAVKLKKVSSADEEVSQRIWRDLFQMARKDQ